MPRRVLTVFPVLFLAACATVSEKPVPLESPVPAREQRAAQAEAEAPRAKRYKTKIAIGRFTNETNYGRSLMTDEEFERIGKQASDMLASRLIASGRFLVLERPDLSKVSREQEISGASGLVGADTLVVGSVTEFGRSVSGKVGFLSSTKVQTARSRVDVRLVDVDTGHAYFSATGTGEASTESGEIAGFGSRADYDATLNDRAIAASISDVVDRLVSRLADRPWKTDILEVRDRQVFLSGGKRQGLREGDILDVMEAGETVRSRQTGFDVTLPPKKVGEIRVLGFFGESETDEGSVCEIVAGQIGSPPSPRLFVTEPAPGGAR